MIPDNALSSPSLPGVFLSPDILLNGRLTDHERGGVALNDGSQGLDVQNWRAYLVGDDIMVAPEGGPGTVVISRAGVQTLSLTFDSNMNPTLAYTQSDEAHLYWFDTSVGMMVDSVFAGAQLPRLCMDDKRPSQNSARDVILAYLRAGNLYYRQQRDRYTVEYLLATGVSGHLRNIGMSRGGRLQFELS